MNMAHGPEHHLEHAEHAQHAAHDPFDKRVTLCIAIVAAILAGVTMAGHKAHNETLRLQGEAIKEQSLVGIYRTDTANQYAFYQSKKNRGVMYEAFLDFISMLPLRDGSEKVQAKATGKWKKDIEKYATELPQMLAEADKLKAEAEEFQVRADTLVKESHATHTRADRFDIGELGLQLGVVLCSLAILTKSRSFWSAGLLCSLLGLLVALSGAFGWFMEEVSHH
jgi:hypothetical protein